jgi:hypothetical protein
MRGIQKTLFDLPPYGDYGCSDPDCTIPAVIRHPQSGKFYCAGHAWILMGEHPVEMEDLSTMIQQRKSMLDEEVECGLCEKPAERMCNCGALICFDHYHLVPRTGCVCPDCAEEMERQAEEAGML